jgi:hypothetical protein
MINAVRFCWQGWKQSTEPYLRTAVDFLLAHNILLRSESRLAAEFPDFFTIPLLCTMTHMAFYLFYRWNMMYG